MNIFKKTIVATLWSVSLSFSTVAFLTSGSITTLESLILIAVSVASFANMLYIVIVNEPSVLDTRGMLKV